MRVSGKSFERRPAPEIIGNTVLEHLEELMSNQRLCTCLAFASPADEYECYVRELLSLCRRRRLSSEPERYLVG